MIESPDYIAVPAGSRLFAEAEESSLAYLIKRGRIEIYVTRDGRDMPLVVRGPGEVVGEIAILDSGIRSTSARALEECELALITRAHIESRLRHADSVLRMLLEVVTSRYRETIARLDHDTIQGPASIRPSPASADFQEALSTLELENDLRRAIGNRELELVFQPIVSFPNRRLAGFESLLRWNHPRRGLLLPEDFLPVAEASGLITGMTLWCLSEIGRVFPSMMAAASRNEASVDPLFVSVNISGQDLAEPTFVDSLQSILKASDISPHHVRLEVTESMLMREPQTTARVLEACRRLGTKVSIDDFGTGYSSLSHLSTLPIAAIQIDKSFVHSMIKEPTSRKIIHMILRLANELDIPVVAEGIETEQEALDLKDLGCALGQGFLFGRPAPLAETLAMTHAWTARRLPDREPRPTLAAEG